MQRYDWDHIDPDYPEGCDRPYQMVCGLTNKFNLIERDRSSNSSKSNRFLPWRVAYAEVGSVPVNPGDLCQFLNRETGEWALEEFMGDWWFKQTGDLCGEFFGGINTLKQKKAIHAPGVASRAGSIGGRCPWWTNLVTGEVKRAWESPGSGWVNKREIYWNPNKNKTDQEVLDHCRRINKLISKESLVKGGNTTCNNKWMCLQSGYITNAPALATYQRNRGVDKSRRVKLTPEESAFIFLWDT
jgi:hypothetical protein